jgi:RimJ/RimL family protein N-acetyltransferase
MAGIMLLNGHPDKLLYVVTRLLDPGVRASLMDDYWGGEELSQLFASPSTLTYGIMEAGKPEPIGVVYFSGYRAFRNCVMSAVIFDPARRDEGLMTAQIAKIKGDLVNRWMVHSVTSYVTGDNQGSKRFLERLGFSKLGVAPKAIRAAGKYQDLTIYYILLRDEED